MPTLDINTPETEIERIPRERITAAAYAASLETIRINRWDVFSLYKDKEGSLDTTTQDLDFERLEPDYIYIITNMTAVCTGTGTPQIALGYERSGMFHIKTKQTVANAEDSVDYAGQIILREGDIIRARLEGATANDTAEFFVDGYKIRP